MIRTAKTSDIPVMLRMARDFIDTGVDIPFDPAYASASLRGHLITPDRVALVLELDGRVSGMLCACSVDSPLAPVRVAIELLFWIDPVARGRWAVPLIKSYEHWARESGCLHVSLSSRTAYPVGTIYARLGYTSTEQTYSKAL